MDAEFIKDLFASVGPVTIRRMFGGQGIYADGMIIAVVLSTGQLHVKGDDVSGPVYEAEGMERWRYINKKSGKPAAMPYWQVPESALDDPDDMGKWARLALETAIRAKG